MGATKQRRHAGREVSGRRHLGAMRRRLSADSVLCRQLFEAVDDAIRRALDARLPGFHVADGCLLQPDGLADIGLRETDPAKFGNCVGDVHGSNYGNSGIICQPVFRY
jgi:hypothetical protein